MKFIIFLFLFLNYSFAQEDKIRLGILYNKIFTSEKDEKINSKIWEMYLKEEKLFESVDTVFYEDDNLILNDFIATPFPLGTPLCTHKIDTLSIFCLFFALFLLQNRPKTT